MLWKNTIILLACILGASAKCTPEDIPRSLTLGGQTVGLTLIGQGQSGCAFSVNGGWSVDVDGNMVKKPAVAKVNTNPTAQSIFQPATQNVSPERKPLVLSVVDALKLVKQYYASGLDSAGREWVVMEEYLPNEWKRVDKTRAWNDFFGPGNLFLPQGTQRTPDQCEAFMQVLARRAAIALALLVDRHQVFHLDFHYGNILANDELTEFRIIDFGLTMRMTTQEFDAEDEYSQTYWYLLDDSQLPVHDNTFRGPGKDFQGVCESVLRDGGQLPKAPFPVPNAVQNKRRSSRFWGRRN